jgi:hypothetical protein
LLVLYDYVSEWRPDDDDDDDERKLANLTRIDMG